LGVPNTAFLQIPGSQEAKVGLEPILTKRCILYESRLSFRYLHS
jgi:hypothetical protein